MEQICQILTSLFDSTSLSSHGLLCKPSSSDIVSTTLLLKDMWNFASVNAVYSSLFRPGEPNPPARVTLATLLPEDVEVSLSVVFDLGPPDARRGLHVQSRSYWAPANIGPYSQAICVPVDGRQRQESETRSHDAGSVEAVHVAGQIPLVPQTMQLSQDGFLNQAALSLQHLWRVGQERSVDIWPWGIAFLKISSRAQSQSRALEAFQIWRQAYEFGRRTNLVPSSEGDSDDDTTEGPDAWDLQFNRFSTRNAEFAEPMSVGKHLHLLPNDSVFLDEVDHCRASFIPPFIAAEVVSLPQDAPIEWWSLGVANLPKKTPTSTPRIKTVRKKCKWGSFCKVSILPPRFADEQDDRSGLNDALLVVHLVTILVDLGPSPIHDDKDDHNIKVIEDDLFNFLCPEAGSERRMAASRLPPRLEVVHGTALVSIEGQMQWSRMMCNQGFFSNLTVIPCRSVVSGPAIDDDLNLDLGRIEFNDKDGDEGSGCDKESSEIFGPGGKIAAGPHAARTPEPQHQVDNTTDSGSKDDRKSTAASGNSHCQPLAVAMTMRIDERP
jgi:enamine deaminase RidA (YjgF/YER057c/UK114 family)